MKLLKRIKNLWRISDIPVEEIRREIHLQISPANEEKKATIVEMEDPLETFMQKVEQEKPNV